jgi:GAF domain-containing protein
VSSSPEQKAVMTSFPLVKPGASDFAGLVAILRRLAIAQSLPEIMQITTQAARTLLQADGITFVLREGDLCYYAAEDAISPLWMGRRFPLDACISGWCMIEGKTAVIADIYQDPPYSPRCISADFRAQFDYGAGAPERPSRRNRGLLVVQKKHDAG